ncbi:MazG nucleotide pyrophosphohydrolase domain-containing protein [Candidatus Leptofilum sp.]|uniref:MazG nucleotide pyrophosphohydrolase domain-containing protein n=1 Tax=Candidatus Leptofilum sp. TaxID=3241576 RepID=UPI003B5BB0B8
MKNWQQLSRDFAQKHNLTHSPGVTALDLLSEFGEVAKELLKATDYGRHDPIDNPAITDELGDMLYSLCQLATAVNVDLDQALTTALAKYEARWQEKGHPGSH